MTGKRAVFTRGPTLTHVVRMTLASTVGLVAMFTMDLVAMFFLSLLGEQELVAAVGFGGALLFFLTAVSIGLQIGMGALVSRAEGAHQRELAGRYCTNIREFKDTDISDSKDLDENTILDIDENKDIVAITIEHASIRTDVYNLTLSGIAA